MPGILLDTHAFLWLLIDHPRLSQRVRDLITVEPCWLSVASVWEISIKHGIGKLPLPQPPESFIPQQRVAAGIGLLMISEIAAAQVHRLPSLHQDPFDRMLISQAQCEGLTLATNDRWIPQYQVQTVW